MLIWLVHLTGLFLLGWTLGVESVKQPIKDPLTGWSGLRKQLSHSRGRDRSQWHQSPLPQHPSQHQSPSPSPTQSCPTNEQLSHSKEGLHLQPRSIKFSEQGAVIWCHHTYRRETTKEETGQVLMWMRSWGWSYIVSGPDPPPSRGHSWGARWHYKLLYSLVLGFPKASP